MAPGFAQPTLCSGDVLLPALVDCAGVTLRAVAASLETPAAGGSIVAEGEIDFRGTLALAKDAPVGSTHPAGVPSRDRRESGSGRHAAAAA
jgi:hypothetical protein